MSGKDKNSERETRMQAEMAKHLVSSLVRKSPHPGLDFQNLITPEPTGQALVIKGAFEGQAVAIKLYMKEEDYRTEVSMFERFPPHRSIMQPLAHFGAPKHCAVFPFADGGDLADATVDGALAPAQAAAYALQIAQALAHLHDHNVVHLDLKGQNVMLGRAAGTSGVEPLLMDFGLAQAFVLDVGPTVRKGTVAYMAPELFDRRSGHSARTKVDVFAFGCLMWEMLTGNMPWERLFEECGDDCDVWEQRVEAKVLAGERPQLGRAWPPKLCRLIQQCWEADPNARPSMDDVVSQLS
jgi:serine/threonine protein kinase